MKSSLFITLLLTLFSAQVFAVDLCDDECTIVIDFPSGGTLKALAPMTFSFGDNGLVDFAPGSTAYVSGNTLILNTDDELTFGVGGYLDIGDAGNITYSDIELSSNSEIVFTIGAAGNTTTVTLGNFTTTTGGVVFEVSANLLNFIGDITINGGDIEINNTAGMLFMDSTGSINSGSGSIFLSGTGTTTVSDIGTIGVNIVQCSSNENGLTISSEPTPVLAHCEAGVINVSNFTPLVVGEIVQSNLIVENPDPELSEQQTLSTEKSGSTQIFYLLLLSSFLFFRTHSFKTLN